MPRWQVKNNVLHHVPARHSCSINQRDRPVWTQLPLFYLISKTKLIFYSKKKKRGKVPKRQ